MAQSKSESHAEPKKEAPISVAVDQELSDSALDEALGEEDPEFLRSVSEIGADKTLSLSQIIITDEQQALNEERDAWQNSGRVGKAVFRVFPGIARVSVLLKKWEFQIFAFLRAEWVRTKNFLYFLATDGKNKVLGALKRRVSVVTEAISESQRNFRYLSWKRKLSFFGILALMGGTGFFIYRSFTHGVIPMETELFIPTMERLATEVSEYDPETEVEPFYDNLRVSGNILLIPKMVVNLRKSAHSGDNPMGAFEFYTEGIAPEVPLEIKDREIEIRDLMQRVTEEFTFDQIDSPEGKRLLCDRLKREVNAVLTTGKLKKVWIKTVIVKP
jgi:hypothetical protein